MVSQHGGRAATRDFEKKNRLKWNPILLELLKFRNQEETNLIWVAAFCTLRTFHTTRAFRKPIIVRKWDNNK